MNKDKFKESCRSIGNSLIVAGTIAAFFSQIPLTVTSIVMLIGFIFTGYGVKK